MDPVSELAPTSVTLLNRAVMDDVQQDAPEKGNSYQRVKKWKAAHPEAVKAQYQRWYARHRAHRKAYLKRYYKEKTAPRLAMERASEGCDTVESDE